MWVYKVTQNTNKNKEIYSMLWFSWILQPLDTAELYHGAVLGWKTYV